MFTIASLLDLSSDQAVRGLWERFEAACGLMGVRSAPLPHFSWSAAEAYQIEAVEMALQDLTAQVQPFSVRTAGLGIFTGPRPVVYISLVKNEALLKLHALLWQRTFPFSQGPSLYYSPDQWVPHITLAYNEVESSRLGCAIVDIVMEKIELQFSVDHVAVLYQVDGKAGVKSRFSFQQEKVMGRTYEFS